MTCFCWRWRAFSRSKNFKTNAFHLNFDQSFSHTIFHTILDTTPYKHNAKNVITHSGMHLSCFFEACASFARATPPMRQHFHWHPSRRKMPEQMGSQLTASTLVTALPAHARACQGLPLPTGTTSPWPRRKIPESGVAVARLACTKQDKTT